ncbi:MAG: hypothetical protein HQL31_05175 [Planctomycetes bacterium]|nr:hypothetical protein [Planctomycetota bacterium]
MSSTLLIGAGFNIFLAAAMIAAFLGFGFMLERLARAEPFDWGLRAALGCAVVVAIGGWLNLCGWIGPTSVLAVLASGALFLLYSARASDSNSFRSWAHVSIPFGWYILVPAPVILAILWQGIMPVECQNSDDVFTYLVFVNRMVQAGSMGMDPYNVSRAVSLGCFSWLQAITVCWTGDASSMVADRLVGSFLLIAQMLCWGRQRNLHPFWLSCALLLIFCMPAPYNSQSYYLSSALFFALCRLLLCEFPWEKLTARLLFAVVLGATLGGLKSTLFAPSAVLIIGWYLSQKNWRAMPWHIAMAFGAGCIILCPWMWYSYLATGTPLYPILGKGVFRVDAIAPPPSDMKAVLKYAFLTGHMILLFFSAYILLLTRKNSKNSRPPLPIFLLLSVALLGDTVLLSNTEFIGFLRYRSPFYYPIFFIIWLEISFTVGRRCTVFPWIVLPVILAVATDHFGFWLQSRETLILAGFLVLLIGSTNIRQGLLAILLLLMAAVSSETSVFHAAPLFCLLILGAWLWGNRASQVSQPLAAGALLLIIFFHVEINMANTTLPAVATTAAALFFPQVTTTQSHSIQDPKSHDYFQKILSVVPDGEKVLATVQPPCSLDHSRLTIYNYIYPGLASPDPRLDLENDSSDFARHLSSHDIRYVFFDREHILSKPPYGGWALPMRENFNRYSMLINGLPNKRILFDDGRYILYEVE